MVGDFNCPHINWRTVAVSGTNKSIAEKRAAQLLMKFVEEQCLSQMVSKPTRGQSLLDLVLTNNCELIHECEIVDPGLSDHLMVVITLTLPQMGEELQKRTYNRFSKLNFFSSSIDWEKLSEDIARVDWLHAQTQSVENLYRFFVEKLWECSRNNVPERRLHQSTIPRNRRILMRKRRRLQGRLTGIAGEGRTRIERKINIINEQLKRSIDEERKQEEGRAVEVIKTNSKYFYSYAKRFSRSRCPIGPIRENGQLISDYKHMAELLQQHYSRTYSKPYFDDVWGTLDMWSGPDREKVLEDIALTECMMKDSLRKLSEKSAAGPDGVPAVLLKKCAESVSVPLLILWRSSLAAGRVPDLLKEGVVTPIHKGGGKGDCANYRPVVLTSHIAKLFECIVAEKMVKHMEANGLLSPNQHGFRKGRSCASQLLQHYPSVVRMLESGSDTDVVYLDFSKAFDKVDQGILLSKLKSIGITGSLFNWVRAFLLDRRQAVAVEGQMSCWSPVISGVPQGTVLGPILFLVYVIDIEVGINSKVSCFADDTRIMRAITEIDDVHDLQADLANIYEWAKNNNMAFNEDKFKVLQYKFNGCPVSRSYVAPGGGEIESVLTVKDLGVTMSSDGTFDVHVENATSKARKMMGWILRTFITREPEPMITRFKAIVLPHLEYCCQVWCPISLGLVRKLEAVQRTFTARLSGMQGRDYWERLRSLSLYSLERRRERYLAIYVWRILTGLSPTIENGGETEIKRINSDRRGKSCAFPAAIYRAPAPIRNMVEQSLPVFGSTVFNSLPRSLREHESSLMTFKSGLDAYLQSIPDKPYLTHYPVGVLSNSWMHTHG